MHAKSKVDATDTDLMEQWITEFPGQLKQAMSLRLFGIPPKKNFQNAILCGMGGSAIGADLLLDGLGGRITIPVFVNRGPVLPIWVNEQTLVVACSYSGDTYETVHSCHVALARNATVVVLTSGGKLGSIATEKNLFHMIVPGGYPPRAALGYMFCGLWRLLFAVGAAPDPEIEMNEATVLLCNSDDVLTIEGNDKSFVKEIAKYLAGKIPWIWAPRRLASVARRWANQFSENSKLPAHWSQIPEAFHNEIIGLCDNPTPFENLQVILMRDQLEEGPLERAESLLRSAGLQPIIIKRAGEDIASLLFLVALGDRVSLAVANLQGVEATPLPAIKKLKE